MNRLLSYLLVLSVVLITIPRSWLHDCDHYDADHNSQHHENAHFKQDDCFACDYDLDFIDTLVPGDLNLQNSFGTVLVLGKVSVSQSEVNEIVQLRGPPKMA